MPATLPPAAPPPLAPIEIVVTDVHSARGQVRVELCTAAAFLKDCALTGIAAARAGTVTVVIPNVPPGRYAVQAAHDENGNGKLDRNMFGIPREGFGFSRDTRVCTGAPKFADAAFDHGAQGQRVTLRMRYHIC